MTLLKVEFKQHENLLMFMQDCVNIIILEDNESIIIDSDIFWERISDYPELDYTVTVLTLGSETKVALKSVVSYIYANIDSYDRVELGPVYTTIGYINALIEYDIQPTKKDLYEITAMMP